RTFVSTRAATVVELFACPTARGRATAFAASIAATLSGSRGVEQAEPFVDVRQRFLGCRNHPKRVANGNPPDVVAGPDTVLVGYRFRHRHLELARHLAHRPYPSKDEFLVNNTGR